MMRYLFTIHPSAPRTCWTIGDVPMCGSSVSSNPGSNHCSSTDQSYRVTQMSRQQQQHPSQGRALLPSLRSSQHNYHLARVLLIFRNN